MPKKELPFYEKFWTMQVPPLADDTKDTKRIDQRIMARTRHEAVSAAIQKYEYAVNIGKSDDRAEASRKLRRGGFVPVRVRVELVD